MRRSGRPFVIPAPQFVIPAKAGIQASRGGTNGSQTFPTTNPLFIAWCAGVSRDHRLVEK